MLRVVLFDNHVSKNRQQGLFVVNKDRIHFYKCLFFRYNVSPWTYKNVTNEAQRSFLIQDLITWKDYVVQVAAYNNKGVGDYSEDVKIKTREGGLLNINKIKIK